jgi:ligand-binding sensor protein
MRSGASFSVATRIAVKVINHYGDEVLKVYDLQWCRGSMLRDG